MESSNQGKEDFASFMKAHQIIASAMNSFNQVDTSLQVLFRQLVNIPPKLAYAILGGNPMYQQLREAVYRLVDFLEVSKEHKKLLKDVLKEWEKIKDIRNILAHQPFSFVPLESIWFHHPNFSKDEPTTKITGHQLAIYSIKASFISSTLWLFPDLFIKKKLDVIPTIEKAIDEIKNLSKSNVADPFKFKLAPKEN